MPGFSRVWFLLMASIVYLLALWHDWPLFVYFPQDGTIHAGFGDPAAGIGPPMHWYGLLATAMIAGVAAGFIGRDHWLPRAVLQSLWLVPVLAMAGAVVLMRPFFA